MKDKLKIKSLSMIGILLILIIGLIISLSNKDDNDFITYGDNFVLQNYIDDSGNVINSALVIYDNDFKKIKSKKVLNEVYDRVDQIDMNKDTVDSGEIHLMLYNSEKNINKNVIINLANNELLLENSKEATKLEPELQIGVAADKKDLLLELSKKDYYKVIKDPNFVNDGKYYTFVDFEQLTNYDKE